MGNNNLCSGQISGMPKIADNCSEIDREHDGLRDALEILDKNIAQLNERVQRFMKPAMPSEAGADKAESQPYSDFGNALRRRREHVEALTSTVSYLLGHLAL